MIEIPSNKINDWKSRKNGKLFISNEKFHRNAELFLSNFPDLKNQVSLSLTKEVENIKYYVTKKNNKFFKRIKADSLNKSIKNNLSRISDIKFEVEYKEGTLLDSPKTGGFDFALYDEEHNLVNFRNYCFGRRAVYNGQEVWDNELLKREEWADIANRLNLLNNNQKGEDITHPKYKPTIIGEVQFGNWGLLSYDLLKVLHLDNLVDLDLLIYVTASGELNQEISDGTVNYYKAEEIIDKYSNILKVPIWLLGVDIR
ncbi:hypothetical protein ERJ70_03575 [Sediminibacillus dalangtanensis]|uniref:Restriction endonuclease BglII n=1 Tax=Sediminibacillus dalangtanensis TaxID=2729421 RepID=A0ABX7VNL1_9BACI|nr:BglII/BstYI family type II restriction endonuclease [Sediminibacillus dalangtanensis]QTM98452.1 hypothetical protein ERJ70_03575 [Sediminibacillus dalangtanensis]